MPTPQQLHIDSALTNLSVRYKNEALIWRQVMPVVKVAKRSDDYFVYNKVDSYTIPNDEIGPRSYPNEYDWGVAPENYSVRDHALSDWIAQESIDNADAPLQPMADTNEFLNMLLDLAQEQRVANIVQDTSSYDASNVLVLSGTSQWGGGADDPIGNIEDAIEACFMRANTVVMGIDVWKKFRKLPQILDAIKAPTRLQDNHGGMATVQECKGLFDIENWIVGRARYNTAKEGDSPTYARLWGKNVAVLYVDPKPGVKTITWGVTFSEQLRLSYRDFDGRRGVKGAHFLKVGWNSDERVIAPDVGYYIQNAVA